MESEELRSLVIDRPISDPGKARRNGWADTAHSHQCGGTPCRNWATIPYRNAQRRFPPNDHLPPYPPWSGERPSHLSQSYSDPVLSSLTQAHSFSSLYFRTKRLSPLSQQRYGPKSSSTCTMVTTAWTQPRTSVVGQNNTDATCC